MNYSVFQQLLREFICDVNSQIKELFIYLYVYIRLLSSSNYKYTSLSLYICICIPNIGGGGNFNINDASRIHIHITQASFYIINLTVSGKVFFSKMLLITCQKFIILERIKIKKIHFLNLDSIKVHIDLI